MKTAVEWIAKKLYEKFEFQISDGILYNEIIEQAKVMEEQEKVEFAFRSYIEKLSTDKDFVEIVNSMRTFKQQEQ